MLIFVPVLDAKSLRNYQHRQEKRVLFARHCQNQHEGMSEYLSKIVFSDECIFRLYGSVNIENIRIWGIERPVEG